jgi:ribonuclease HII
VNERFAFDLDLAGRATVAGADEAGRGCLAGPLVAAAVCFDYAALDDADLAALDGLHDSKKVPKARRAALYVEILRRARQVVIVCCSAGTIDREGLHRCNLDALARAVEGIAPQPAFTLIDGFVLPGCSRAHRAVVGGDGRSAAIAAASVVAKVTRDRLMLRLHDVHPQYGFDRHVGYATAMHRDAIMAYGVCELHRLSFASVAYRQLGLTFMEDEPLVAIAERHPKGGIGTL